MSRCLSDLFSENEFVPSRGAAVLINIISNIYKKSIHCYKCDSTENCKTIISNNSSSKTNYEIIDCEHYCSKSISLGNVYRGCAIKRCAVSHTIGTFSSSVCCQTDYCNKSNRVFISKYFLMTILAFVYIYIFDDIS